LQKKYQTKPLLPTTTTFNHGVRTYMTMLRNWRCTVA